MEGSGGKLFTFPAEAAIRNRAELGAEKKVHVLVGGFGKVSLQVVQLGRSRLLFHDTWCGFLNSSCLFGFVSSHLPGLLHLHEVVARSSRRESGRISALLVFYALAGRLNSISTQN